MTSRITRPLHVTALLGVLLAVAACSGSRDSCTSGPCVCEATARFTLVGSMTSSRTGHTATLLQDGRVLVTGGSAPLTELFDPSADTFTVATQEGIGPDPQGAVRLQDSRVFFIGDDQSRIYNPSKRTFLPTDLPLVATRDRTAVLLPTGKVLITGGWQCGATCIERSDSADAELFDPARGNYSPAGPMTCPRSRHSATLLPNGKVLLVGGLNCAKAELYDPSTGAFTETGPLFKPRTEHSATLLRNGSVLVAGGKTFADQFAGDATAELYDASTGTFSQTGNMMPPRTGHTATLLTSGKVLMAGGVDGKSENNELYDPATGAFTATARMEWNRAWHTATLLGDGRVLIAGGVTNLAEVYIPACE